MFSIIQLKSFSSRTDFFDRLKSNHFFSMFVEEDTDKIRSYKLKKMINKRLIVRREPKYLIKWKEYDFEENVWRNLSEMKNAMDLIKNYERMVKNITYLFERLNSVVLKSTKLITSSPKASITSFEVILQKSLMIISIPSKISSIQIPFLLKISSIKLPFSPKASASSRRFSRLLLSSFWWMICWRGRQLSFFLMNRCYDYCRYGYDCQSLRQVSIDLGNFFAKHLLIAPGVTRG